MKTRIFLSALLAACYAGCTSPSGGALAHADRDRFAQVVNGKSTKAEVRASLGAPARSLWLRPEQREAWGYPYRGDWEPRVFWIQWSADGTVFTTSDDPDPDRGRYRGS